MAECGRLATCIFFNDQMDNMPTVAHLMKKQYCEGDFDRCARYQVAEKLGGPNVPRDLYPNDFTRAKRLLSAA
jgi:hypothetical protein